MMFHCEKTAMFDSDIEHHHWKVVERYGLKEHGMRFWQNGDTP